MPAVRSNPKLIALAIADLHLSLKAPACREEEDWLAVQAGYLDQVKKMLEDNPGVPLLCAGDIFDRHNVTPELINFALDKLPDGMICVAGNHELPNHRFLELYRSGYGVLENAGKIRDISPRERVDLADGWCVRGFGFGFEPSPTADKKAIALVHGYVWRLGSSFAGAPKGDHYKAWAHRLKGYDVAVFGDNHQRFTASAGGCHILNCGTFIRRKLDEIDEGPAVGAVFSNGDIAQWELDISKDLFVQGSKPIPEASVDMRDFLGQLDELGETKALNFQEQVRRFIREQKPSAGVEALLLKAIST